jgi:hypothetical protein
MSGSNARVRKIIEVKGDLPPEEERAENMVSDYRVRGFRNPGDYEAKDTDATNQRGVEKRIRAGKKKV